MDSKFDTRLVICLAHGAWHQPLHLRYLINALKAKGYTVVSPQLATSNYDDAGQTTTYRDDVNRIHEALLPFLDKGHKALLVGHSFGGMAITAAAWGQTVEDRAAKGLPGGVSGLVYMGAFVDHTKPKPVSKDPSETPFLDPNTGLWHRPAATEAFYHDADPDKLQPALEMLLRLSPNALDCEPICTASQIQVPKHYFVCGNDRVIPAKDQREWAQEIEAKVIELNAGHSPFLINTEIETIVQTLVKLGQLA